MSVDTPLRPLITTGRVLYVFPELNIYAVQPRDGLAVAGEIAYLMAIDISSHNSMSRVGVSDGSSYAPGSDVVLLSLQPNNQDAENDDGYAMDMYSYILGPSFHESLTSSKLFSKDSLDEPFLDFFTNQVRNAISKNMVAPKQLQDKGYGRPIDMTAGDFLKSNMFGGQIRLTMMRAAVGASPRAQIQMSALDDSIDTIASRISVQNDAMHHTEYPAWDDFNRVYRYARTKSEGLGAYDNPLKENEEETGFFFYPQQDDQQGIFRQISMHGPLVEGSYDLYMNPEKVYKDGDVRQISNSETPPFGLSAIQRTYDGTISIQGVKNVGLQRSAYVWCPRELEIEDNNPELHNIELDPPATDWSNKVNIPTEQRADYASLMKDKRQEDSLVRYLTQIEQKAAQSDVLWSTYDKKAVGNKYGEIIKTETELEPIADNKNAYESTPTVEITDPLLPEETIKLQALLSCVELDETGAVLLHDGYGSEIRMSRGHISLRPALDLKFFPGRSVIGLVPKDTIMRTREYVEISSDQNDMMLKSQRDMKLLSGNGESGGMLTLENRSDKDYNADQRDKDERSGGICIKSYKADLSITAPNLYMGLFASADASVKGRTQQAKGTLTIDAGGGLLTTSGDSKLNNFASGAATVVADRSIQSIDGSGVILAGSSLGIACPTVQCGPVTDSLTYPVVTGEGVTTKTLMINTSNVNFKVAGNVTARTGMFVSSCLAGLMSADNMSAASGAFGNASQHSQLMGGSGPGNLTTGAITVSTSSMMGIMRGMVSTMRTSVLGTKQLGKTGFTGYGILYSGFFYQQENKYDTEGMVEARYQRMLRNNGAGLAYWNKNVKADEDMVAMPETAHTSGEVTEAWPGTKAESKYKVKTISNDGLSSEDKGTFREAYIINQTA